MNKLEINSDLEIVKAYLNRPYRSFVKQFSDIQLMEYVECLDIVATKMVKRSNNLGIELIPLSKIEVTTIDKWLSINGTEDDCIYFGLLKLVSQIMTKYYDITGSRK